MQKWIKELAPLLLVPALGGLLALYTDVQVLKSQVKQLQAESHYFHGDGEWNK